MLVAVSSWVSSVPVGGKVALLHRHRLRYESWSWVGLPWLRPPPIPEHLSPPLSFSARALLALLQSLESLLVLSEILLPQIPITLGIFLSWLKLSVVFVLVSSVHAPVLLKTN